MPRHHNVRQLPAAILVAMKNILQYMRQLRQRRLAAFELSLFQEAEEQESAGAGRLAKAYGHTEVDARVLRRRLAELEYDDEN
ncbi:hypothetical protein PIGHUM_02962 [Pigmentiphaga humi]|uniref:Uncharacterized protein n=2 Tax=Pigmentiphaga humi TaxID=2478468 RepID=A0A3P4B3K7_9BURK|nr:hypothetical protein PIGHUM_02962 [Pigmentiphaga humi]